MHRIKIGKSAAPAWPSQPAQPALSWPSMPESISYLSEHSSWGSPQQSVNLPPASKITHSYLPADYFSDHVSVKQKNDFLTSYIVKDGPGLEHAINNAQKSVYNSGYNGNPIYNTNHYREIPDIESRRPVLTPINKPIRKQPAMFGQPLSQPDDYENGKGSAAVYNDASAARSPPASTYTENAAKSNNNRVQFQTSVGGDYASPAYNDANNIAYKNEISNDDSKIKSVSSDYLGDANANQDNYEESNELVNENVKDQATYFSNSVPAMKNLEGYKKSKV